jgi:hypothetical protein
MRMAKVAFMNADITLNDLGDIGLTKSIEEFNKSPWKEQFGVAIEIEEKGGNCISPDITFRIDDVHLSAQLAKDGASFNVEVWVVTGKKILGIFGGSKCYKIQNRSQEKVVEYLEVFLALRIVHKWSIFQMKWKVSSNKENQLAATHCRIR